MTDFTKQESKAIRAAFDTIAYELSTAPHEYGHGWREAFKLECRHCGERDYARLNMVASFAAGVRAPCNAAELFGFRPGSREAHMIGAALHHRAEIHHDRARASVALARIRDEILTLCDAAKLAGRAASDRRFANLEAQS